MHFVAVLYQEDGTIVQTMTGQQHLIEYQSDRLGLAWLRVDEERSDYDVNYLVIDGTLVAKEQV